MLAVFLIGVASSAAPPLLTAETVKVDRGEIKSGPVLKQVFKISNSSTETIRITGLESTCGCLRRTVSKSELSPGMTAEISMDVNTLTQPEGSQVWTLTLRYRAASWAKNTPDEQQEFRVLAKLTREVRVTPPMISVTTTSATTATIAVTDQRTTPFTIKKVVANSPHLVPKVQGKPGQYTIELAIDESLPAGTHDATLIVQTNDTQYSELQIPARVVKRDRNAVSAYPESLELEELQGIVQFRRAGGQSLKISSATTTTPGLTVTMSEGRGTVATVKVVVGPDLKPGKGEIKVVFAEPEGAERIIPVRWGD